MSVYTDQFPGVKKGVGKLQVSIILQIIAVVLAIIGAVVAIIGVAGTAKVMYEGELTEDALNALTSTSLAGAGIGAIIIAASGILLLVAFIINIIGLVNGSSESSYFKLALILVLLNIVFSIVSGFIPSSTIRSFLSTFSDVVSILEIAIISLGLSEVMYKINNSDAAAAAKRTTTFGYICLVLVAIMRIVAIVSVGVAAIFGTVASVVELLYFIFYLITLSKAKKALA